MSTPAERDIFEGWRLPLIFVGTVLFCALLWNEGHHEGGWSLSTALAGASHAMIPELLGAIAVAFVVYYVVRQDDRQHYVHAMRAIRASISSMQDEGTLDASDVQRLMTSVVPSVSNLYFKKDRPLVPSKHAKLNGPKAKCFSCKQPSPIVQGRCQKCSDILDSWRVEERAQPGDVLGLNTTDRAV